jgi:hypothetical protein
MHNKQVEENLIKAALCAKLLNQVLKNLISTSDPLLAQFALNLFQDGILTEQRLQRALAKIQNHWSPQSSRSAQVPRVSANSIRKQECHSGNRTTLQLH